MEPYKPAHPSLFGRWLMPVIISLLQSYTWYTVFFVDTHPGWRIWIGLVAWLTILYSSVKHAQVGIWVTLIWLAISVLGLLTFLPWFTSWGFQIGPVPVPLGQPTAWLLLIVHASINFNALVDAYLDYRERKQ